MSDHSVNVSSPIRKLRQKGGRAIEWTKIRSDYIYGEPEFDPVTTTNKFVTMRELGARYDINPQKIMERASKEKWFDKRRAYRQKVADLHDREMNIMSLRKSALTDGDNLARLDALGKMFDAWLAEYAPEVKFDQEERDAYLRLCAIEGIVPDDENENTLETNKNGVLSYVSDDDKEMYQVGYQDAVEAITEVSERKVASIKELSMAIDVLSKMHKLNRDIMGEPINYHDFYVEKAKEAKRIEERGKAVNKDDIRDLIETIRGEGDSGAKITLDVDAEECE
jgi:hypothetical protein